jgi:hypothetical protein
MSRRGRRIVVIAGSLALVALVVAALGADLWSYAPMDQNRFTSMAMATGTLRLRGRVQLVGHDEQVYNGAVYTNWGFGVPLLQLPFQEFARHVHSLTRSGFFPDRAIFFVYAAAVAPLLWLSLRRLLEGRAPGEGAPWGGHAACAFAATCTILVYALFPLIAYRFCVWEETIAYFVLAELCALSAYCHLARSERLLPAVALGLAAGMGVLVRATGLVYFVAWAALVLLSPRPRARIAAFGAAAAPLLAFWMISNQVKSGSPFSFGYSNSLPGGLYQIAMQRFGSECADTPAHAVEVVRTLLADLFTGTQLLPTEHLKACHWAVETQEQAGSRHGADPLLGGGALVVLLALLTRHAWRRERRIAVYVPFAAMAIIFLGYARVAMGIAWRYAGDFWPLVALAVITWVERAGPLVRRRVLGFAAAIPLSVLAVRGYERYVAPVQPTVHTIAVDSDDEAKMTVRFGQARWEPEAPYPTRVEREGRFPYIYDLRGWDSAGAVDTYTNLYVGVPPKTGGRYELRIETAGGFERDVRVYVNGRFYDAHVEPDRKTYRVEVPIDYAALRAPIVMVTIRWTRDLAPARGGLNAVELL